MDRPPETPRQFFHRTSDRNAPFRSLLNFLKGNENTVSLDISVDRHSNHYVHERSTTVNVDFQTGYYEDEAKAALFEKIVNELEDCLKGDVIDINKTIYRDLEKEWDYQLSDEVLSERLTNNDQRFDEDGDEADKGLPFDQLEDYAKEKALDRERDSVLRDQDTYWSECITDDWKSELDKLGFSDSEISWSGFSSQGDGASFTCKRVDTYKILEAYARYGSLEKALKFQQQSESAVAVRLVNSLLEATL